MTNTEVLAAARSAVNALTNLSEHAWTNRGTASALLDDSEAAAVEDAIEALDAALERNARSVSRPSESGDTGGKG